MKDNDFTKFYKGKIILDETPELMMSLNKQQTFKQVIQKDADFFAKTNIIDYSLLVGQIKNPMEELLEMIEEDPSLTHGVFISREIADKR